MGEKVQVAAGQPRGEIQRRTGNDPVPLSFAQQRLWFLDKLEPSSPIYNEAVALRFEGTLDVQALEKSLDTIFHRHESLRTVFVEIDGNPMQVIRPPTPLELRVSDLSSRSAEERKVDVERISKEEVCKSFDLSQGPLLRLQLLTLRPDEHILLTVMHHIVSDGWSMEVFCRELAALYQDFVAGRPPSLPELAIQYGDFALWQRRWLQGAVLDKQLAYWKQQLRDAPAFLDLPTDRLRPTRQSYRGSRFAFELSSSLADSIRSLCIQERVTGFMALLSAFGILLYRYSGQTDIVIGSPFANRNRVEFENLIGFFVNSLPMRIDLSEDPSYRELLKRVRKAALGAFDYQHLPFERLVEELRPPRDTGRSPLFQVMFAFQSAVGKPCDIPGVAVTRVPVKRGTAKFDLILFVHNQDSRLSGTFEYNSDLFDHSTIERMAGHFRNLLESMVADPGKPIGMLPLLAPAERDRIVHDSNVTETPYPRDACIHSLFENQAARKPEAPAVVFGDTSLSYGDLNRRANRLAGCLRRRGVGPGVLVGVCLERCAEMVVAFLAVLKAGGAYVPLDTTSPAEWLRLMVEESDLRAIVTQRGLAGRLAGLRANLLVLESSREEISGMPDDNCSVDTTAESLAYVIYTSGSTGSPKGVAVPHRAVNRLVINTNYVQIEPRDVIAQVSNCSFDAATFEIWGALLNGARLSGIPTEVALSTKDFARRIREQGITVMFLTTSLFNQMAREAPSAFGSVRTLLVGGEAAQPKWMAEVLKNNPPRSLLNVYGPTEGTTFAAWHRLQSIPDDADSIPIGRPVANTTLFILDSRLEPVPVGVPGELFIAGDGLAKGYLNRPELTDAKFITSPFPEHKGQKLFRTGDIARFRPNGDIEFIGRADDQIKIRGFRVELAGIESVLARHPAVLKAAVLADDDVSGNKRVIAYVVHREGQSLTGADLRLYLKNILPEYMVPFAFAFLPDLPLNSNGKLDRSALPAVNAARSEDVRRIAPRDALESGLVEIWQSALQVSPIGVQDNFFDLGGHSLLAAHIAWRIEKEMARRVPLALFFQAPTIAELAGIIRDNEETHASPLLARLQPYGSKPPFFLVHGDYSNVLLPRHFSLQQPMYGIVHQCHDGRRAEYTDVKGMAERYLQDVHSVQPEGPYFLGGASFGGIVAYEMAQQLLSRGEKVGLLVLMDPTVPRKHAFESVGEPERRMDGTKTGARPLREEIWRHLKRMKELSLTEQISYVQVRVRGKIEVRMRKLTEIRKRAAIGCCIRLGRPLPVSLRSKYLIRLYARAAATYEPLPFAGPMALLIAKERGEKECDYWRSLAGGKLEFSRQPGNHMDLFSEEGVGGYAHQLRAWLEAAQSATD